MLHRNKVNTNDAYDAELAARAEVAAKERAARASAEKASAEADGKARHRAGVSWTTDFASRSMLQRSAIGWTGWAELMN